MSHQDAGLYKSFAAVLGALVLFTLFIIVVANMVSPATDRASDPLIANSVKKQIEPVGRSNVRADAGAEEAPATTETAAVETTTAAAETAEAESTAEQSTESAQSETAETTTAQTAVTDSDAAADDSTAEAGATQQPAAEPARADASIEVPLKVRAVVATNCAGCHANGVKGAQRNDDTAAWQGLADKGLDALTASVINGKGAMPARAESTLDDAQLKLAVQHMINKNLAGVDQSAAATDTESTENTSTQTTATESTATETAAVTQDKAAEPATETVAAASTEAVAIPDNVKAAVDTLCAACHISGVGNAPKYGDKEAWDARMANGLDAVTASAIAGKGAMPARGGSQLTDEEIKLAIQYMVTK